jgi:alkylation response protein AidB-like acyl-CoA dehydrogenase
MTLGAVAPFLEARHGAVAAEAAAFAGRELAGLPPADDDAARVRARDLVARLGRSGLGRYAVAAAWGGALPEVDLRCCCLVREALAAASPLADAVFGVQCLGAMPLHLAGNDEQRRRWLPGVAAGEVMTAFAMTEPDAGSDVGSIATRATRDGDRYLLDGRKAFISNAGIADLYVVFASTKPEAGRDGLSCFLVPAGAAGLALERTQVLSEPHPLGEISFRSCPIPASDRVGEEGEGFRIGMQTLDRLRPTVAAAACGMAARALEEALAHARRRRQFGRPLAEFQLVQEKLARMATALAAARLLTYAAAWEGDQRGGGTLSAAMAKAFATEAAQRIVDDAVQILGGRGVLAESPVDRLYRSVRALRIYEGTTEIQRLVIARELLRQEPTVAAEPRGT